MSKTFLTANRFRPALAATMGVLVSCCLSLHAQTVSLVGYWNFNDATVADQSRATVGDFTGVLENGIVYTPDAGGRSSQAGDLGVDFGTTANQRTVRVSDMADALNTIAATDMMSISIWIRWNQAPVNSSIMWMRSPSASAGERGWQGHVPYGNGTIYFDTGGTGANTQRISTGSPAGTVWPNTWHHVAYVKNAGTKQIWLDGRRIVQGTTANPLVTDFTEILLGLDNSNTANQFRGILDDFAVFSGALEEGPIRALANGTSPTLVADLTKDLDGDQLPGWWEELYGFNSNDPADAAQDTDADGLTNLQEFQKGTLPRTDDSDADGLKDGVETGTGTWVSATDTGTNPLVADSDGDLAPDGVETNTGTFVDTTNSGTDPNNRDTDGDRLPDGAEISMGTNPTSNTSTPSLTPGLNLLAFWDFNDASVSTHTLDRVHNYQGLLENGAVFTADAAGRTAAAGDRGVNFGNASSSGRSVRVPAGLSNTNITGLLSTAAAGDLMSVSYWQKWNGAIANSSAFWMVSPSTVTGGSRGFQAHVPYGNGNVYFDTGSDGAANYSRINANISTFGDPSFAWDTWHHIVLVKNVDRKEIWIDGKLFLDGTSAPPLPADFFELYLGMDFSAPGNTARIIMDDFAIFGSALDESKIKALRAGVSPLDLETASGDADSDGLPNFWEDLYGLNKNSAADASLDGDADGLTNLQEYAAGTAANNADTDGDGLKDGVETKTNTWVSATDTGTDPLKADTDRDGIPDGAETRTGTFVSATDTGTDPNVADSDGDGYGDGVELALGSNPTVLASTPVSAGERNLLAYWDFNNGNANQAADKIHGFPGNLTGGAVFTSDTGGRTAQAGDAAIDMGSTTVATRGFKVANAGWLNAASVNDAITISFWQKWNVAIANSSAFWFFSPSALNGNRGAHAETPWGTGDIPWDTGGTAANSQRIQVNFSTFTNVTTLSFFTSWHHFAFVKEGVNKAVYIDGRLFNSGDAANPLVADFTDIYLGVEPTGANNMRGIIDDFAVYASALTEEQIGKLAQGASPITLELPAATFRIVGTTYAGGNVTMTWESTPGKRYRIHSKSDLGSSAWTTVTEVDASAGATTSYSPTIPAGSGMAFYLVQAL